MRAITYVSSAKELFSERALLDLLEVSRANNARFNITGLLLYKGGSFIQVIEGPDDAISQLYKNICADKSHHNVITLIDEATTERTFPDWHMGFASLTPENFALVSGYSRFLHEELPPDFLESLSHAKCLLGTFHQKVR